MKRQRVIRRSLFELHTLRKYNGSITSVVLVTRVKMYLLYINLCSRVLAFYPPYVLRLMSYRHASPQVPMGHVLYLFHVNVSHSFRPRQSYPRCLQLTPHVVAIQAALSWHLVAVCLHRTFHCPQIDITDYGILRALRQRLCFRGIFDTALGRFIPPRVLLSAMRKAVQRIVSPQSARPRFLEA